MGVQGLWELLAPVGRRVSVETLAGKKLAIDASIWMIQFMKAMRDEKGEMVRNAHILGFFRRICKLLYLRTKPVFVFDGGTPALKRRTVIARRRQRENAQAKIRKTAEKLLLNHLKAMRLKELAAGLEKQRQENAMKGKRPMIQETNHEQHTDRGNDDMTTIYNQEEIDALLAASLAAEEDEGFGVDASTSGSGVDKVIRDGDEDEDDDEEMILPEMHGKVDPAILAALPPSMQLDLLVQMRERLMAENRQKYQKVKKAPASFSELQIQSYLKTVAFRREIDGVQKSAARTGIGGMQTSRIASEANREFIFSSSFTGDKEALTSVGQERVLSDQSHPPPMNSSTNTVNSGVSSQRSDAEAGPTIAETGEAFHDDVETYVDEKGRLRVSRVRALGIRMTRDLQRNLDLMKEIDQEKSDTNPVDVLENTSDRIQHQANTDKHSDGVNDDSHKSEAPVVVNGTSMEISFEDTCEHEYGNDDDILFARLVAGDPVVPVSVDNVASEKQSLNSDSDCEWEDGVVEDKSKAHLFEAVMCDADQVEWEEEFQDTLLKSSSYPNEGQNTATKGALQEEADLQEAIRRSLDETSDREFTNRPCEDNIPEIVREMDMHDANFVAVHEGEVEASAVDVKEPLSSANIIDNNQSEAKSVAFTEVKSYKSNLDSILLDCGTEALARETLVASDILPEEKGLHMSGKQQINIYSEEGNDSAVNKLVGTCSKEVALNSISSAVSSSFTNPPHEILLGSGSTEAQHMFQAESDEHSCKTAKPGNSSAGASTSGLNGANELSNEKLYGNFPMEKEDSTRKSSFMEGHDIMEDHLEEEMLLLGKEREELGTEQRKLERNAESVSSEMFAECQELLQMFGLPYIIAPMEAEAQCAFMELLNLVDGVVTDDSDAFLFGARSVYKNIFDDRKYVETYLMKDIENELGLDREKLIHMALLLGSDYTEGVSGIGIVNAIEVVNAFPEKDGLREFREWIESPDPTILGKLDVEGGISKRKGSKNSGIIKEGISSDQNVPESVDDSKRIKQIFMNKHRNVSKNWHIPSTFPSDAVISAYVSPQVDKSTEPFAWGKPDLFVLRKLCWEKFGWGTSKADELLLPVLKEYNKHETQLRLEAFYTFNERFAKIRSNRIKKAVKGITGNNKSSELMDKTTPGKGRKRKAKPIEDETNQSEVGATELDHAVSSDQTKTTEIPMVKRSKGGLAQRGRGRGQASGRGRRKRNTNTSYDDGSSTENEEQVQFNKSEESHEVRRSGRVRKTVDYDEHDNFEKEAEKCPNGDATNEAVSANELNESRKIGMGEMSTNQIVDSQIDDPLKQSQLQNDTQISDPLNKSQLTKDDYLQFGGGFCVDEDDKQMEVDGNASSLKSPEQFDSVVEENHESDSLPGTSIVKTDLTNMKESDNFPMDDTEDVPGNSSLRAMPNLRRKKRKL